jgi:short-subunit dehydrogenase/lysophospholipase L1-like esterase
MRVPVAWERALHRRGMALPSHRSALLLGAALTGVAIQGIALARAVRRGHALARRNEPFGRAWPLATARVLLLGDSTGAGVGVERPEQTLAGLLAHAYPRVELLNRCRAGACVRDTLGQARAALRDDGRFTLALVAAGGNDVLRATPLRRLAGEAHALLEVLQQGASTVAWLGCADPSTSPSIGPPLAWLLRRRTRRALRVLETVALGRGARFVAFHQAPLRPLLLREPGRWFAADTLHPGPQSHHHCFERLRASLPLDALLGGHGSPPCQPASSVPQGHAAMVPTAPASRPLAVVTGASSGIGLELARCCAAQGFDLLIAADDAALDEAAAALREHGVDVAAVRADLATRDGVQRLVDAADGRPVDALLANAGHGLGHAFLEQDFDAVRHVIDTNITGTIDLVQRMARGMKGRGQGRILLTGSIVGFMPGSFQAVYNATKAFVDSFAYALRNELKDSGVTVSCLMPGATDTAFFERAGMLDTQVGQQKKDDAADVARAGFKAMMNGDARVITGVKNKLQVAVSNLVPDRVLAEKHRQMAEPGRAKR